MKKAFRIITGNAENGGTQNFPLWAFAHNVFYPAKKVYDYKFFPVHCRSMGQCNTILNAYTLYRHFG